jgi:hypothetical protein
MKKIVDNIFQIGYPITMFAQQSRPDFYYFYYTWRGTGLPMG